jgi:hypothetical protein
MADLTTKKREHLPDKSFGIPSQRAYPLPDKHHARLALAMVSKYGSEEEEAEVRKRVKAKFPDIDAEEGGPTEAARAKARERTRKGKI